MLLCKYAVEVDYWGERIVYCTDELSGYNCKYYNPIPSGGENNDYDKEVPCLCQGRKPTRKKKIKELNND